MSMASSMTASVVSASMLRSLAISRVSASISSSRRKPKICEARSGPSVTSRIAAFSRPFIRAVGEAAAALISSTALAGSEGVFSSATGLLLVHPGADLLGDALGLGVDHLLELAADGVLLAL